MNLTIRQQIEIHEIAKDTEVETTIFRIIKNNHNNFKHSDDFVSHLYSLKSNNILNSYTLQIILKNKGQLNNLCGLKTLACDKELMQNFLDSPLVYCPTLVFKILAEYCVKFNEEKLIRQISLLFTEDFVNNIENIKFLLKLSLQEDLERTELFVILEHVRDNMPDELQKVYDLTNKLLKKSNLLNAPLLSVQVDEWMQPLGQENKSPVRAEPILEHRPNRRLAKNSLGWFPTVQNTKTSIATFLGLGPITGALIGWPLGLLAGSIRWLINSVGDGIANIRAKNKKKDKNIIKEENRRNNHKKNLDFIDNVLLSSSSNSVDQPLIIASLNEQQSSGQLNLLDNISIEPISQGKIKEVSLEEKSRDMLDEKSKYKQTQIESGVGRNFIGLFKTKKTTSKIKEKVLKLTGNYERI